MDPGTFLPTRTLAPQAADVAALDLAARIVDATDFSAAYDATADALARAGIRIETPTHVFVEPIEPTAGSSMWPRQVLEATLEAMNRRYVDRISADDAGTVLAALGWPMTAEGGSPGQQWLSFLQTWQADAKADPADPTSFAPLFAAEMIRLGDGVDLAQATPADVHFGLLELIVLSAAFEREPATARGSVVLAVAHPWDLPKGQSAADSPCNSVLERYGIPPNTGDPFNGSEPDWMRKGAIGLLGPANAGAKALLKAMSVFQKIWRAAAFYFYSFVRVENTDGRVHKPNEEEPDEFSIFSAKTGVDPDAFKGWVKDNGGPNGARELNDATRCAESLGLPTLTDVGDVATDAANWIVDWEVLEGMPMHAELAPTCGTGGSQCNTFDRFSTLGMKLHGSGASTYEANLWVKIQQEKKNVHVPAAMEKEARVSVRAKVDSSKMPSISPGNLTSPGGLLGPGLETIVGFIQSAFKPAAKATLIVTYHVAPGWTLSSPTQIGYTLQGQKCDDTDGEWTFQGRLDNPPLHSEGTYTVTIAPGTLGGTFQQSASTVVGGFVTRIDARGHASIAVMDDGTIGMTLDATQATSTANGAGGIQTFKVPLPAQEFTWQPDATNCPGATE